MQSDLEYKYKEVDWYEVYGLGLEEMIPDELIKMIVFSCDFDSALGLLLVCKRWSSDPHIMKVIRNMRELKKMVEELNGIVTVHFYK